MNVSNQQVLRLESGEPHSPAAQALGPNKSSDAQVKRPPRPARSAAQRDPASALAGTSPVDALAAENARLQKELERLIEENLELEERRAILAEEIDLVNDRFAAIAAGDIPTEVDRQEARDHIDGLRKGLQAMTIKVERTNAMYDCYLTETNELKRQCKIYRRVLQKLRREGRSIPAMQAPLEDDDGRWEAAMTAYKPQT